MLKAKYHIILCFLLIFLVQEKLCAQIDSNSKKSFGFVQINGGISIAGVTPAPNLSPWYDIGLEGVMPIKHSHWGLGFSVIYNHNNFDNYLMTRVYGFMVSTPGLNYVSSFNAHLGVFFQIPFFQSKGTFYMGLLGGVTSFKIPEYLYSDTAGLQHTTSQNWPDIFASDQLKASCTAFSANFKIGLFFPILKKLLLGFNFEAIYSNLTNGLTIYTQNYYPRPYPPRTSTTSYVINYVVYLNSSITIGFKID